MAEEPYLEVEVEPGAGLEICVDVIAEILEKFRKEVEYYVTLPRRPIAELAEERARELPECVRTVYESVRDLTPLEQVLIGHGLTKWWYTIYYTTNR